jgi:hypothetical protein
MRCDEYGGRDGTQVCRFWCPCLSTAGGSARNRLHFLPPSEAIEKHVPFMNAVIRFGRARLPRQRSKRTARKDPNLQTEHDPKPERVSRRARGYGSSYT